MTAPLVSLVISTYNRKHLLLPMLLEFNRQTLRDFEIIIADDGSSDGTVADVAQLAGVVNYPLGVVTHEHRGYSLSRSRNNGVAATRAPLLVFMDDDCRPNPKYLESYYKAYQASSEASLLVGDSIFVTSFDSLDHVLGIHPGDCDIWGLNLALPRDLFLELGGFDEDYVNQAGEDSDLALRLHRIGVPVTRVKDAHVYHLGKVKKGGMPDDLYHEFKVHEPTVRRNVHVEGAARHAAWERFASETERQIGRRLTYLETRQLKALWAETTDDGQAQAIPGPFLDFSNGLETTRAKLAKAVSGAADVTLVKCGNQAGDLLAWAATRQFFGATISRERRMALFAAEPGDTAVVAGHACWDLSNDALPILLNALALRFRHIVVLPATYQASGTTHDAVCQLRQFGNQIQLFARDLASFHLIRQYAPTDLAYDASFLFNYNPFRRRGAGQLTAYGTNLEQLPTPSSNEAEQELMQLNHWLNHVAQHAIVHTDNAETMIAAAMLGKRVYYPLGNTTLAALVHFCLQGFLVYPDTR